MATSACVCGHRVISHRYHLGGERSECLSPKCECTKLLKED